MVFILMRCTLFLKHLCQRRKERDVLRGKMLTSREVIIHLIYIKTKTINYNLGAFPMFPAAGNLSTLYL